MKSINTNGKPLILTGLFWVFDSLSAIGILALAIKGAAAFIKVASTDVKTGMAIVIVGLLATRLIERVFDQRR